MIRGAAASLSPCCAYPKLLRHSRDIRENGKVHSTRILKELKRVRLCAMKYNASGFAKTKELPMQSQCVITPAVALLTECVD